MRLSETESRVCMQQLHVQLGAQVLVSSMVIDLSYIFISTSVQPTRQFDAPKRHSDMSCQVLPLYTDVATKPLVSL